MSQKQDKTRSARSTERDLNRLVEQATARPGVAEVVRLSREYQERLAEIARRTGRLGQVIMTTTDSTA